MVTSGMGQIGVNKRTTELKLDSMQMFSKNNAKVLNILVVTDPSKVNHHFNSLTQISSRNFQFRWNDLWWLC